MNAIFQALAYVPSVRAYSEKHYGQLSGSGQATGKVVGLFHGMYTGKYSIMLMDEIVNKFKVLDPLTFLEKELYEKLDEGFFEGFSIVKVSLLV